MPGHERLWLLWHSGPQGYTSQRKCTNGISHAIVSLLYKRQVQEAYSSDVNLPSLLIPPRYWDCANACCSWSAVSGCSAACTQAVLILTYPSFLVTVLNAQGIHGTDNSCQWLYSVAVHHWLVLLHIFSREAVLMDDPEENAKDKKLLRM